MGVKIFGFVFSIVTAVMTVMLGLALLQLNGVMYECNSCEKITLGTSYSIPYENDYTMCKNCAIDYFAPFDIKQFKK